jgi:hypothetical protein
LVNLQLQLRDLFAGALGAHGRRLAGVGGDFRAVDTHRHLAKLGQLQLLGQLQDLDETLLHQRLVLRSESADRVVVRVGVAGDEPHGHIVVGGLLDAAGSKGARRVAVHQQAQQQGRRILLVARAAGVDPDLAQVDRLDRIDDEVCQMVGRHPVPQVRRQQQGGGAIDGDEACCHVGYKYNNTLPVNIISYFIADFFRNLPEGLRKCLGHFPIAACRIGRRARRPRLRLPRSVRR